MGKNGFGLKKITKIVKTHFLEYPQDEQILVVMSKS